MLVHRIRAADRGPSPHSTWARVWSAAHSIIHVVRIREAIVKATGRTSSIEVLLLAHHVLVGIVALVAHSLLLAVVGMHVVVVAVIIVAGGHWCIVIVVIVVATSWSLLLIIVIIHLSVVPITLSRSTLLERVMLLLLLVMMIAAWSMMLLLPHLIVATVVVTVVPGRSPVRLMLVLVPFLLLLWMTTTTTTTSLVHLIRCVVVITPRSHPVVFGTHSPGPPIRLPVSERSATLLMRRWNRDRDIVLLVRVIRVSVPVTVLRLLPVIVAVALLVMFSRGRRRTSWRHVVAPLIPLAWHRHCLLGVLVDGGRAVEILTRRAFPRLVLLVRRWRVCRPRLWLSGSGDNDHWNWNCYGLKRLLSGSTVVPGLVAKGVNGSPQETVGNQRAG